MSRIRTCKSCRYFVLSSELTKTTQPQRYGWCEGNPMLEESKCPNWKGRYTANKQELKLNDPDRLLKHFSIHTTKQVKKCNHNYPHAMDKDNEICCGCDKILVKEEKKGKTK